MAHHETEFSGPKTLPLQPTKKASATRLAAAFVTLIALAPSLLGQIPRNQGRRNTGPRDLPTTEEKHQLPAMRLDERTGTISFSMAESMELADFIKWAQTVTGKRFTFHPVEFTGSTVHFLGEFRIARDRFQEEFYSFFQTMLYIKGFAIVPRGEGDLELLEIVMMTGSRGREISNSARYVAPDEVIQYRYQTGVPILTTIRLKHINAQIANNALRPFFASTGGANAGGSLLIGNVGNKSSLLLQGYGPKVYAAMQLLRLVDEPEEPTGDATTADEGPAKEEQAGRIMRVVALKHADAGAIERTLHKLLRGKHHPQVKASTTSNEDAPGDGGGKMEFSMKYEGGMKLVDFIKWAQEVTGKRFTFNTAELASGATNGNRVHFLGKLRVDRNRFQEEFYAFFQTMLYIKGFAIVPRGEGDLELLEIVMMRGARGREVSNSARYVAPAELHRYRHQTGVPILTTVKLDNINAQLAHNALRPFFASTGGAQAGGSVQIGNVGNKSSLLLQGFGPQVFAAAELLKLVDEPAEHAGVVAKAMTRNNHNAIVISGRESQVRNVLKLIETLDQPSSAPKQAKGFGFTNFGQATFVDTDDDGLPDTRLPSFEEPRESTRGTSGKKPNRRKGKSFIF